MKLAFLTILLVCSCAITAFAQNSDAQAAAPSQVTSTDLTSVTDVRPLFAERETRIEQIKELDLDIAEQLEGIRNLPPATMLEQNLQKLHRDLEIAQRPPQSDQQRIDELNQEIAATDSKLQTIKNSEPRLRAKKADQDQKRQRLLAIESRIASLFDATRDSNRFRSAATYAFTFLVLVVVGGFFFIAYQKDGIAAKIFGGEMGMQFVTLFLIVIAIILFGIMGTLEGKELAALLGGLSGYILGRTGVRREGATNPEPNPNPNANPNPNPNLNLNPNEG